MDKPDFDTSKSKLIKDAFEFAATAHKNQNRLSGEPFINHPINVANIIFDWLGFDENLLAAALLHDVIEDTPTSTDDIRRQFGTEVIALVEGVSKLKNPRKGAQIENVRKMAKLGYLDPKIFILKLADRLHNMRTLRYMNRRAQKRKALETKEIYSKLAESLGMWEIKKELDDLAFQYLNPTLYRKTKSELDNDPRLKTQLKIVVRTIRNSMPGNIRYDIYHSINSLWAIELKKIKNLEQGITKKKDLALVNDLVSIRVLTTNIENCYRVLGIIEKAFRTQIDGDRFDNFLLRPTINGYSALQTTINTPDGAIEIAVTTYRREKFNSYGILNYLKANSKRLKQFKIKVLFSSEGDVYYLPENARVIDLILQFPTVFEKSKLLRINGRRTNLFEKIPNGSFFKVYGNNPSLEINYEKATRYCLPSSLNLILNAQKLSTKENCRNKGKQIINNIVKRVGILDLEDLPELVNHFVLFFQTYTLDKLYLDIGLSIINRRNLLQCLNSFNLGKDSNKYTSIYLTGKNNLGILAYLSDNISHLGGNIISIHQTVKRGKFYLRFLIEGLDKSQQTTLEKSIINSKLFTHQIMV